MTVFGDRIFKEDKQVKMESLLWVPILKNQSPSKKKSGYKQVEAKSDEDRRRWPFTNQGAEGVS